MKRKVVVGLVLVFAGTINKCAVLGVILLGRLSVGGLSRRKRPVILGDAGPEDPDHNDREECKE